MIKLGASVISPWKPITDPIMLATLGKTLEELGELTAAISRCIIQGVEEKEPVTGKPNLEWLAEEIADVIATLELTMERTGITRDQIMPRVDNKVARLVEWRQMLREMK